MQESNSVINGGDTQKESSYTAIGVELKWILQTKYICFPSIMNNDPIPRTGSSTGIQVFMLNYLVI